LGRRTIINMRSLLKEENSQALQWLKEDRQALQWLKED
jgi:hypothetical protein